MEKNISVIIWGLVTAICIAIAIFCFVADYLLISSLCCFGAALGFNRLERYLN